jgi:hypothetical protein
MPPPRIEKLSSQNKTNDKTTQTNDMKSIVLTLLGALALAIPAFAADDHDHAHDKVKAGPNGGRVLTVVEPHLEFYVTKDRKVEISALNDKNKAVALAGQTITVTAGDRSKPTKLEFKADGDKLVSTNALPAGNDFPVSVAIKATPKAKLVYAKFNLNLNKCPDCKNQEYACECDHSADAKDPKKK